MKINKKAFTIIELIVVIAILGILILLAMLSFGGQTRKAKVTLIRHDIKVAENAMEMYLIDNNEIPSNWRIINNGDLNKAKNENLLYNREGLTKIIKQEEHRIIGKDFIKEKIKTKLPGDFYVNQGGEVFYQKDKVDGKEPIDEVPDKYIVAEDLEFTWVTEDEGVYSEMRDESGYYSYRGNKEYIIIPEIIHGEKVSHYHKMFSYDSSSTVKGVSSKSVGVNYMGHMFEGFPNNELEVKYLRTQDVDYTGRMFRNSNITELDLRYFNFDNLNNAVFMFEDAIIGNIMFDTFTAPKLTNTYAMFKGTKSMNNLNLSYVSMPELTAINEMFADSTFKDIDIRGMDIPKVYNAYGAFLNARVDNLYWSNSVAPSLDQTNQMFRNIFAKNIDLESLHLPVVGNGWGMFFEAKADSINLDKSIFGDGKPYADASLQNMFGYARINNISMEDVLIENLDEYGASQFFIGINANKVNLRNLVIRDAGIFAEMFKWADVHTVDMINVNFPHAGDMYGLFLQSKVNTVNIIDSEFSENSTSDTQLFQEIFMQSTIENVNIKNIMLHKSTEITFLFNDSNVNNIVMDNISAPEAKNLYGMFANLITKNIKLSNMNMGYEIAETSYLSQSTEMFLNTKADKVSLSNLKFNVQNAYGMFNNAEMEILDINNLEIYNIQNEDIESYGLFMNSNINTLNIDGLNMPDTTGILGLFKDATFNKVNVKNFPTSHMTKMDVILQGTKIPKIDLSFLDTSNTVSMGNAFNNAIIPGGLDLSMLDLSKLTQADDMFKGLSSGKVNLVNLVGENLVVTTGFFENAEVESILMPNLTGTQYMYVSGMFENATVIKEIDISSLNSTNVDLEMDNMFLNTIAQVVYARSQLDIDSYKNSENGAFPSDELNFTIK